VIAAVLLAGSLLPVPPLLQAEEMPDAAYSATAQPPGGRGPDIAPPRSLTREEAKASIKDRRQAMKARQIQREARRTAQGPRDYSVPKPPPNLPVPPLPDAPGGEFDPAGMRLPAEVR